MNHAMKWHHIMGDEKLRMKSNHKKKNENLISRNVSEGGSRGGGGNEIAGLVLAVAGFIAVVSLSLINKNRKKGFESNPKPKPLKNQEDQEIETNQGLHILLQPSSSTTKIKDTAPCHGTIDTESINHTFIQEEKIDTVANINDVSEVVFATSFQEEIVLSNDSNSESGVSSHDSRIDEDCLASLEVEKADDGVVSEIVEEKDCSSKAILINSKDKQDFNSKDEGGTIEMQNEEHEEANTDMEVNDEDQAILVSNSFQLTTLLMLLPGLILLLVILLLMLLTQKFSFLQ
ncbi:uncharacterized protein LOC123882595 [Trifolium pratense]|uniref:uncharacterized protein LOC123882595 n=1 Tax=Trifolium pratense TaxID=57577 RepID=UPI001E691607|nr:uncharacterized protein LOC123882595 [Trifolium pratense]